MYPIVIKKVLLNHTFLLWIDSSAPATAKRAFSESSRKRRNELGFGDSQRHALLIISGAGLPGSSGETGFLWFIPRDSGTKSCALAKRGLEGHGKTAFNETAPSAESSKGSLRLARLGRGSRTKKLMSPDDESIPADSNRLISILSDTLVVCFY